MLSIDAKDKKLLYEIDLNARLGTTELAKKVGISQEGVYYRLQRLEKRNIISSYMTLLNFSKIGYTGFGVYARFQNVSKEQRQTILQELAKHNHIYWIAQFGGRFDLAFALMAKNVIHFNEMFSELANKYSQSLKDFTVAIRVELLQFPRDYLLKALPRRQKAPRFGTFIEAETLDDIDKLLLKELTNNCRLPLLELSRRTNHPASTLSFHLKKLETKEIIQGYSAQIHCQGFGYQSYQLFLTTHNLTIQRKRQLLTYCQMHPNIIFYIETVGKWNFEIIYEIESQERLQDLIIELRTQFSEIIQDVESIIIFNHYVKYNQYPL